MSGSTTSSRGLPYVAGLDGVRGLPLVVMMAYHLEWSFVPGGVFSVSLFFTLSGYLITQLIVREHALTTRVDLGSFWSRRLRRLMPASLVTIGAVALVSVSTPIFDGPRLRGDLFAALGYSANWRFAITGNSYEEQFTATASPVQHFWSLAIEEQVYFVFPLVMIALLATRRRGLLVGGLVALAGASVIAGLLTDSRTYTYYGTHVRVIEVLAGAILALVVPIGREIGHRLARSFAVVGSLGLIVFGILVATVHTSGDIVYDGGLALFSVVSCALIVGALVPGPVRTILSSRPLVAVGRISYGAYVYHWPIFLALDPDRVGFDGWILDGLKLVATFAVTVASFRWLEEPIRRRRVLTGPRPATIAVAIAVTAMVAVIVVVPRPVPVVLAGVDAPDRVVDFSDEAIDLSAVDSTTPPARRRVLVVGSDASLVGTVTDLMPGDFEVVDRSASGCALGAFGSPMGTCPSLADVVNEVDDVDVVVIGLGEPERKLMTRLAGEGTAHRLLEFDTTIQKRFSVPLDYSLDLASVVGSRPTVIVDAIRGDELGNRLADRGATSTTIAYVDRMESLSSELDFVVEALASNDDRPGVVVIGDSVSFGVARVLNDLARERLSVVWAGGRNCPLVEVERIRWWKGVEFDMTDCPTMEETWAPLLRDFRPAFFLVVVSVPEQSDQQYESDGSWFRFDDPEFVERHDRAMQELVDATSAVGARLVVFDSPSIHGGALGSATFGESDRVEGWNAAIRSYADRWPTIEVFGWAEIVARYESESDGGPGGLRADGVHMGEEDLARILEAELLPVLDGRVIDDAD